MVGVARIQARVHSEWEILKGFLEKEEGFRRGSQKDWGDIWSRAFCTGVLAVCAER